MCSSKIKRDTVVLRAKLLGVNTENAFYIRHLILGHSANFTCYNI